MTDDLQKAFDQYLHHSRVLDIRGSQEFSSDGDYRLLCSNRAVLSGANLNGEETRKVEEADRRLHSSFTDELLGKYEQATVSPVRSWWG